MSHLDLLGLHIESRVNVIANRRRKKTGEQLAALNSEGLYVNVHSNLYPGGQIRGQIGRTVLTAKLTGSQENPPTPSAATGTGVFSVDPVTRVLSARVVTSGITATAAHIHAGAIGVNAPVLIPTTQSAAASPVWNFAPATLSEAQYRALLFGNMYVNTHSATYPGGEARAQIGNIVRTGLLSGANEVPSNTSTGSGRARADLNSGTLDISITVTTTGVPGAAAHLHIAATGVNGPIIVPLTEGPTGTWTSAAGAKLTQAQAVAFAAGGTYFNVHSAALPGGEIRAQASGLD